MTSARTNWVAHRPWQQLRPAQKPADRPALAHCRDQGRTGLCLLACLCLFAWSAGLGSALGGEDSPDESVLRAYQKAKAAYEAKPRSEEAAWQLGRAAFEARETATNKTERAAMAEKAIDACRKALAQHTNSAPLHYYLGLNLGALAETRGLSALRLVSQMEDELLVAISIDPKIDHAGPERSIGMLYRDAPAFASVGSKTKARQHLLRAVQLVPDFPENRLELIRSCLKWNDRNTARQELHALEERWAEAKAKWSGPQYAADWAQWEDQLQKLKKQLGEPARLESPRH